MYPMRDKEIISAEVPQVPEDCYAAKARNFYWVLGVLFLGVIAFLVMKYSESGTAGAMNTSVKQYATAVAYSPCPYCDGMLDSQGRCNVRDCPIYSPEWGTTPQPAANVTPTGPAPEALDKVVLIKELAAEVATIADGAVIIHSIYIGGNAQKAGLLKGDIIINFNGRAVKKASQFQQIAAQANPESYVMVEYIRDNEKFSTKAMIGEGEMEGVIKPVALKTDIVYPGLIRR